MPAFDLDIRTVFFTQVVINLTLGLALWVATRGRYQYGLNYFICLFLFQVIAQGLYFFRGILPDVVTVLIANVLLIATYNLGYMGYCRFFNKDPNWWLMVTPIVIILVVFAVYIDNFRIRVITLGTCICWSVFNTILALVYNECQGSKTIQTHTFVCVWNDHCTLCCQGNIHASLSGSHY